MKSRISLILLAALATFTLMTGSALAFSEEPIVIHVAAADLVTYTDPVNDPILGNGAIIRIARADGQPLANAAYKVWGDPDSVRDEQKYPLDVDGEAIIPLEVGPWNVLLPGIDMDLVTIDIAPVAPGGTIPTTFIITVAPIEAQIKVSPRSLNVDSKGRWVNAKLQLPRDYSPININTDSIALILQFEVEVVVQNSYGEDITEMQIVTVDGIMADRTQVKKRFTQLKFVRSDLTVPLKEAEVVGNIDVKIVGEISGGQCFEGQQTLKVINKEKTKALKAEQKALKQAQKKAARGGKKK